MAEAPALNAVTRSLQKPETAAVGAVKHAKRSQNRKFNTSTPSKPSTPSVSSACTNCGKDGHASRSGQCPAGDKECNHCGRTGHYSRCCRQRLRETGKRTSRQGKRPAKTNQIDDEPTADGDVGSVFVYYVDRSTPGEFRRVQARVDSKSIDFVIDLGSKVSIISSQSTTIICVTLSSDPRE